MININISDDRMKAAIKKACAIEDEIYDKQTGGEEHVFSEQYRKKMQILLIEDIRNEEQDSNDTKRKGRIPPKRYIAVAILIAAFISSSVFAGDFIRNQFVKIYEKLYPDHTNIWFENDFEESESESRAEEAFEIHRLEYVPDEYELISEESNEDFYDYSSYYSTPDEEKILLYTQTSIKYADMIVSSDGESAVPIIINEKESYYIRDESGHNSVIYIGEDYIYLISSNENVEDIIKIIEKNKNIK